MDEAAETRVDRVARRRAHEDANLFARIPAAAMASRLHAKSYLDAGGGLSIPEWRILWDLFEAGPLSMQDMASIQRADHSLISRTIPAMRQRGYVDVKRDDLDRRQSLVYITDRGREAYHEAAPFMKERRRALAEFFEKSELATFLDLLDRFEDFLKKPRRDHRRSDL